MKPHNSARQAVLKRKREEAEEEARARLAKLQSEKDARAAKRRRVDTEKTPHPVKKPQKSPKRGKPSVNPRVKPSADTVVPIADEAASLEADRTPPLEPGSEGVGDATGTTAKGRVNDPSEAAFQYLLLTARNELRVRPLLLERNQWNQLGNDALNGPEGIKELGSEIDSEDIEGLDPTWLRRCRQRKRVHLKESKESIGPLENQIWILGRTQSTFNDVLYDLPDFSRDNGYFKFLSDEFWRSFEECRAARTVCKDLEAKRLAAKQVEKGQFQRTVERSKGIAHDVHDASAKIASASQQAIIEDGEAKLDQILQDQYAAVLGIEETSNALYEARSRLSDVESTLNSIMYDLLVENKFLQVENATVNIANNPQEPASPPHAHRNQTGTAAHADEQPVLATTQGGDTGAAPPENDDEAANTGSQPLPEANQEIQLHRGPSLYEILRADPNREPLTETALAAHTARVRKATNKRERCRDKFAGARYEVPDYAESWDEDGQAVALLKERGEKGRLATEAEKQYRDALHEAQRVGAVWYTKSQTSHFRISASEISGEKRRYIPSEDEDVFPLREHKRARIQDWTATAAGEDEIAWVPDLRKDKKMDRAVMLEQGYGEDSFETSFGAAQRRLNREREYRETLRRELQQAEQRDVSSRAGNSDPTVEQGEEDLHFVFAEDYQRLEPEESHHRTVGNKRIPPPAPAENDLHPINKDASIPPEISQPWGWADVSRPLMRMKDVAVGEEAQKPSEDIPSENKAGQDPKDPDNEQNSLGRESCQGPPYDSNAPLIDYAIDGYDGENMDGIE